MGPRRLPEPRRLVRRVGAETLWPDGRGGRGGGGRRVPRVARKSERCFISSGGGRAIWRRVIRMQAPNSQLQTYRFEFTSLAFAPVKLLQRGRGAPRLDF